MRRHTLTDMIVAYKESGEGKQELIDKTAIYVYTLARHKQDWDEDEASEFFCQFLPKISSLIDRFVYYGKPFEAYLISHVKWNQKSFSVTLKKRRREQELFVREDLWEIHEDNPSYIREPAQPPDWLREPTQDGDKTVSPVWRQRLLYLCCRECEHLENTMLERIAAILDIEVDFLLDYIEQSRTYTEAARLRHQHALETRNSCYIRLQLLETELSVCGDQKRRLLLQDKITRARATLERRNMRLHHLRVQPSNRDISSLLNVPKGTVDSGLYYLFHRLPERMHREDEAA